ncbi:hypothetical protein [Maricaulis sp. MIT060901]|uniref:hypothetical protein n=1 Tax=Maricaulis sp. MIT060901 TaxID=3096993 RepID=UPI00399A43A5
MPTSAPTVIAKSGVSATIQSGGLGLFQLVFRRATVKAELSCRGHKPVDEARSNLIALIGQQRYDGLQTEIAIEQAISAAALGYASSQDE